MEFRIDFNRDNDDRFLIEELGAYWVTLDEDWADFPCIKLKDFDELKELLDKVKSLKGDYYDAVVSFDPPTIFLDKDV